MLGISKNWYNATVLDAYIQFPNWNESKIHIDKESKWGALTGFNLNVPIYKNLYTNANVRYSFFPTADFNKHNLITELGLGYKIFGKKKR